MPPDRIGPTAVRIPKDTSRQLRAVLRLGEGDHVVVLDGVGTEYLVELVQMSEEVVGRIVAAQPTEGEPALKLHLFQAIPKARKLELILQKCTELGVSAFTPVVSERSVPDEPNDAKLHRYQEIVREAAEQSGRGCIPQVTLPQTFHTALASAPFHSLLCTAVSSNEWLGEPRLLESFTGQEKAVGLFIGPEGGFAPEEIRAARERGLHFVDLGKRTLRAETAAIVASALVLEAAGEIQLSVSR